MNRDLLWGAAALLMAYPAAAEVKSAVPAGFEIVSTVTVHASPKAAFAALAKPQNWWNSDHTFSHDAKNLSLDLRRGGCFCETLKQGGWVRHLAVTMVRPGEAIELAGALGPLRAEGVAGALRWSVKPAEGGATITQSYIVGGYLREGGEHWAPIVDEVLADQMTRLARFIDTGTAAPKP